MKIKLALNKLSLVFRIGRPKLLQKEAFSSASTINFQVQTLLLVSRVRVGVSIHPQKKLFHTIPSFTLVVGPVSEFGWHGDFTVTPPEKKPAELPPLTKPFLESLPPCSIFRAQKKASFKYFTVPETNSSPLKMDGWNTTFLLGFGLFSRAMLVSVILFSWGKWQTVPLTLKSQRFSRRNQQKQTHV